MTKAEDAFKAWWENWTERGGAESTYFLMRHAFLAGHASITDQPPEGYVLLPEEPSSAMLDRAVAFALNVSLGGDYSWTDYMRDLWKTMLAARPAAPTEGEEFVSACCEGEMCFCGAPASAKVAEVIFHDDPLPHRHELTSYVCAAHFRQIMGSAAPPPPGREGVRLPTNEREAMLMEMIGLKWLQDYAPHRLTERGREREIKNLFHAHRSDQGTKE